MVSTQQSWLGQHRLGVALSVFGTIGTAGYCSFSRSYHEAEVALATVAETRLKELRARNNPAPTVASTLAAQSEESIASLAVPSPRPPQRVRGEAVAHSASPLREMPALESNQHSYMVDGIAGIAGDCGLVSEEMLHAVRDQLAKELPIHPSDEALKRGLVKAQDIVTGAAKDLGIDLNDPRVQQTIGRTYIDYKWAEAFLEAKVAFRITTLAEMESFTPAQWAIVADRVNNRTALERAQLGTALLGQFVPYIQQLLQEPTNSTAPSWRR